MQVRFLQNLGLLDIAAIKKAHGIELNAAECKQDCVTNVPDKALDYLTAKYGKRGSKHSLFEPVANVKGEAKKPEVTAPSK